MLLLTKINRNVVTPTTVQRTVQLMWTVTVAVQTETSELSGHGACEVTFPLSVPKLK